MSNYFNVNFKDMSVKEIQEFIDQSKCEDHSQSITGEWSKIVPIDEDSYWAFATKPLRSNDWINRDKRYQKLRPALSEIYVERSIMGELLQRLSHFLEGGKHGRNQRIF